MHICLLYMLITFLVILTYIFQMAAILVLFYVFLPIWVVIETSPYV